MQEANIFPTSPSEPISPPSPIPLSPSEKDALIKDLKEQIDEAVRVLSLIKHDHIGIDNPRLAARLEPKAGKYHFSNSVYTGQTICGIPHGHGRVTLPDGDICIGTMYNFKWEGEAVKNYPDGDTSIGSYKNGELDGYYELTNPSGHITKSCFKDGKQHGPMYSSFPGNGTQFSLWKNGVDTGEYMQLINNKNTMRSGRIIKGNDFSERRTFALEFTEEAVFK